MAFRSWATRQYWHELVPQLHIEDAAFHAKTPRLEFNEAMGEALTEQLVEEGYWQLAPLKWDLPIKKMAQAVTVLEKQQCPPVFAFVYDEFWLIFHQLGNLIAQL